MKPSNVQTKNIVFGGVDIQPVMDETEFEPDFDWNGVNIGAEVQYRKFEDKIYSLYLRLVVNNDTGKTAPYTFDVLTLGLFEYLGEDEEARMEDLLVVNGLSILYGTTRELITAITARMPHGSVCLPGVSFLDHRPSLRVKKDRAPGEGSSE